MKILATLAAAVIAAGTLTACETSKQTAGTLIGAGTGAAIGSALGRGRGRIAGAAIGAILGGVIGNQIGKELDRRDREIAAQNANYAMENNPPGTTSSWRNQQTGNSGTVTPTSDFYRDSRGRRCKDFRETVTLQDGRSETVKGTRCQSADGSWEFVG